MNVKSLGQDLPASLVVFLIALPLSMGIAIASGVPPELAPGLGLLTAIIGGFVVGTFGGAPLQISGPSAGLAVLVMQMVEEHGMAKFGLIVIIAGAIQLLAGVLRLGRQFQAVSPAVIRGMLSGIGVLIILSQFHVMLDADIPGGGVDNLLGIPPVVVRTVMRQGDVAHLEAALIGVFTFLIVLGWEKFKPKKLKVVPGPLLGVIAAAAAAAALGLPIRNVDVPENLLELVNLPTAATLSHAFDTQILFAAAALAFVASAETLLCAGAVSRMHDQGKTDYDRELAVHGVANALCGVVGTLPLTGVISRSTANVEAGAETRWAAPMHAIWIALFVVMLPGLLALVPTSSLAAILVYIGIKLINVKAIKQLSRFGWQVMFVFGVTVAGVVMVDLLKGIIAGLVLSALRLMYQMSHVHFELEKTPDPDGEGPERERWDLHLHGSATFLALPRLQDILDEVKVGVELHFHFDELEFIDHACLDLLSEFRARHEARGGLVVVEWGELMEMRRRKPLGRMPAAAAGVEDEAKPDAGTAS